MSRDATVRRGDPGTGMPGDQVVIWSKALARWVLLGWYPEHTPGEWIRTSRPGWREDGSRMHWSFDDDSRWIPLPRDSDGVG